MNSTNQTLTNNKQWAEQRACRMINFILNALSSADNNKEIELHLKQLACVINNKNRLEDNVFYQRFIETNDDTHTSSPAKTIKRLIEYLTDTDKKYHQFTITLFLQFIESTLTERHEFTNYFKQYRDEQGLNLAMRILKNYHYFQYTSSIEAVIKSWIALNDDHVNTTDNFGFNLNDYLLSYSIPLYKNLRVHMKKEDQLVFHHSISGLLNRLMNISIDMVSVRNAFSKVDASKERLGPVIYPIVARKLKSKKASLSVDEYRDLLAQIKKSSNIISHKPFSPEEESILQNIIPKPGQQDIEEFLHFVCDTKMNEVEFFLFHSLLLKADAQLSEDIIRKITESLSFSDNILTNFMVRTPFNAVMYENISGFISTCYKALSKQIQNNFAKNLSKTNLNTFNQINLSDKITLNEIDILLRLIMNNGDIIDGGELYLLNTLFNKCGRDIIDHAITTIVFQRNPGLFTKNILRLFFMLLEFGIMNCVDTNEITAKYKGVMCANMDDYPIPLNAQDYLNMVGLFKAMFEQMTLHHQKSHSSQGNQSNVNMAIDGTLPANLHALDSKDQLIKSVLPIQGLISSTVRKHNHNKFYSLASYQNNIYVISAADSQTKNRIMEQLEHINFIPTLMHVTNATYLNQLLDSCILSRKHLESNNISFFRSALNQSAEPADYDVVCFGIHDVDSLALQNASSQHPPARIIMDFKKLLQQRHCIPGQIFVKEHDLLWSTKPDSQEKRNEHAFKKKRDEFARLAIPDEFAQDILLGDVAIKIYRNACGVKFEIGSDKYILHYSYYDGHHHGYDKLQTEDIKNACHIVEEVIEQDFGETLFYGSSHDIEKFFVMQFFRHIEKLPKLRDIVYKELNKLSDTELLNFLNQVGKNLSVGAEFNFQRGFYIPIDCIIKIETLSQFNISFEKNKNFFSSHYGCNHFFYSPDFKPITIQMNELVNNVRSNNIDALLKQISQCPQLFESNRFIGYLLHEATPESNCYHLLASMFNTIHEKKYSTINSPTNT